MATETLLVIDGNSLAHRAFHAIPLLSTTQGVITNAVYGFTNMLLKVLGEYPAQFVAVCFDKGKITFRHDAYEEYKAHRRATPDELRTQFPLIKELLCALRIQIMECDGYEADDLIGTIIKEAQEAKITSIILTGDQDALQLVSPVTKVLLTRKGITELEEYTEGKVWERFGVTPAQFADFKGLVGDQSDNIPGVPGIGAKTAAALLKEHGSLENLINHAQDLPERYREKIQQFAGQAILSKRLATIRQDAPLEIDLLQCRWEGPDYHELLSFFNKLEFKSLLRSLTQPEKPEKKRQKAAKPKAATIFDPDEITTYRVGFLEITRAEQLTHLLAAARRAGRVALALEGSRETGVRAAALALIDPSGESREEDPQLFSLNPANEEKLAVLREICADPEIEKIAHDGKDALWLLKANDIPVNNLAFDTMVAAYLINPGSPNLDLPDLALENLNVVLPAGGPGALPARADAVHRLTGALQTKLHLLEVDRLFAAVEIPLINVLAEMEMAGVAIDEGRLSLMSAELGQRIQELAAEIYLLAGEEFNINSTKQLAHILFEKLQLPVIKRTKTGYSTDVEVLEELAGAHPVINKILEHRQLVKLKSTYVDGLAALISPRTGRIHTTFHQTVTATGRLSSSDPNLQNIPVRLEEGRKIRQVFVPRQKGNLILAADYSQIELRILAHMTGDPSLVEAFQKGEDIHTRTAAEVFSVAVAEVTTDLRTRAKAVNFGIVYGLSDYGLARDINVSRQEAKQYIENYFNRYKGVKEYIERTKAEAREKGYVTTILNRRRYLPELFSPNRTVRSFGERAAINTPIQGSAADIIKLAMLRTHEELKKRRLQTKMILQVHDELIFDVPAQEVKEVAELVRDCMENAIVLKVPLVVEIKAGPNWYETKPL
ncbi:MAG: DNA polymerase I [Bacillota bacterium]